MKNIDKLRSITLGSSAKFKSEIVKIGDTKFEIRQPSIRQRNDIRKASMSVDEDESGNSKANFDFNTFSMLAIIELTVDPETKALVFSDADRDLIEAQPAGGWVDKLGEVAQKLCNVKEEDLDDTKKK